MREKWKKLKPEKKKTLKWYAVFWIVYMISFVTVEQIGREPVWIVHCSLDDMIPFCKYSVYFYLLWFPYIIAVQAWYWWKEDVETNRRMLWRLGWALFPVILFYFAVPTGLQLRPSCDIGNDFTAWIVKGLWMLDSPANVCPSIHVILSVVMDDAVSRCALGKNRKIRYASHIAMTLIVISTMLMKQHSVIDVICGFIWGWISIFLGGRVK
jgi:membrane-associated phospholipid phosphatase